MGTALLLPVPQPTASRTSGAWQQRPARLPSRALLVQCQAAPGEEAAAGGPQSTTAPAPRLVGASRRQVLLGGLAACACCPPSPPVAVAADWNYNCPGPAGWGGTCRSTLSQSPVDIALPSGVAPEQLSSPYGLLRFDYPAVTRKATVVNTGHGTPQVNLPDDAIVWLADQPYQLVQYHFHCPSEHTIGGRHAAVEAHLVHKHLETGELLVLGALLQPEAEQAHPGLQAALEAVPARAGYEAPLDSPISLLSLLPPPRGDDGRRPYATYAGSLTTPPCSEGVRWVVFLEPVRVQASQVLDLMMFCGGGANMGLNARPVQPLEGRQLQFFV